MKRILALIALALLAVSAHADLVLRQSTASQAVMIGPFVDSTDGNTAETALTIDAADVRVSKNGANIVGKNSGGCTHDELGYYTCTFDATDTDTVGRLQVMVHESGALPVYHEFQVAEEAVYDGCCASSAAPLTASTVWAHGDRTVTAATNITSTGGTITVSSGAVTVGTNNDKTDYGLANDAISAAAMAPSAGTEIAAAVSTAQGTLTGTCDSGSTTTCVDNALTQADATQLEDRLICFDDSWCALITTFTPGTDTATTTKVAPSTRASKAYTIFPATLE